ncbi:Cation-chloride cotransporter 1 [Abeliophyllum distichum]|uniref:Cation-chloride cotransporter 1 n=1 Tax=Abeliophyllum distichum TaxID=126358 RepID=A0ABD1VRZ5_9LAMI
MGTTMSELRMPRKPAKRLVPTLTTRDEGVAEIVVAPSMSDGFRGIENLTKIPATFVGIINDYIVANKDVVIVNGLDKWPNEYQRQYRTIDLIVQDGGLMLLLSQLFLTKESFESCKIQVFYIAEEDSDAEELVRCQSGTTR